MYRNKMATACVQRTGLLLLVVLHTISPALGILWLLDHIPQISQFKSFIQLLTGDWQGARKTQHNFLSGPLFAHLVPVAIDEVRTRTSGDSSNLSFVAGDVIFCRVNGPIYQVLLATSSESVIYAQPDTTNSALAALREDPWTEVTPKFSDGCFIDRLFCSKWFIGLTRSSRMCNFDVVMAIERAKGDLRSRRTPYYDQFYCNCEHWVSYWYRGYPYSGQAYLAGKDGWTSLFCGIKQ